MMISLMGQQSLLHRDAYFCIQPKYRLAGVLREFLSLLEFRILIFHSFYLSFLNYRGTRYNLA